MSLYQELMEMTTEILKIIDDYEDKLDFKKLDALVDKLNENENDLRAALNIIMIMAKRLFIFLISSQLI